MQLSSSRADAPRDRGRTRGASDSLEATPLGWRAAALLVSGLGASACHEVVAVPSPGQARSAVLVISERETPTGIVAVDLAEGWPAVAVGADADLHSLMFSCDVDRLGLEVGDVPLGEVLTDQPWLPEPVREAHLTGLDGQWQADPQRGPAVQEALRMLPLDENTACTRRRAQLEAVETALPADGHNLAAFIERLPDGDGLVASREGFYYRVDRRGGVEVLPRLITPEPRAAHVMDDGTIFVLDNVGALHRGRLDGTFEVVAQDPALSGLDAAAMTGAVDPGAPPELYLVTSRVGFHVFDGQRWTATATASSRGFSIPKVVRTGAGRAVALGFGPRGRHVLRYASGSVELIRPPGDESPVGIERYGDALTVGMDSGQVYLLRDRSFTPLRDAEFGFFTHLLAPLPRDGVLIGGVTRVVGFELEFGFAQWFPDLGFCPPQILTLPAVEWARLDDETWLMLTVTTLSGSDAFNVALIRQAAPPAGCSDP